MSRKPTKKSDLHKDWLQSREVSARKIKIQPEYHLIITEGTNTEPQYFEALKRRINQNHHGRIQVIIQGIGENTIGLFQKAQNIAVNSPNEFKHVWIVYDTDDFPDDYINRTQDLCLCASSQSTQYHAIWSNQCTELWFLLHFAYYQSDIHRKEYWEKLSHYLCTVNAGAYRKNREDMFDVLLPFVDTAIRNAKQLEDKNQGKTPAQSAPGTQIYRIIEKLKPYL